MSDIRELDNPFFRNYVFTENDAYRMRIKWWHYPALFFKPMYVQLHDKWVFSFKIGRHGEIYLFNTKVATHE